MVTGDKEEVKEAREYTLTEVTDHFLSYIRQLIFMQNKEIYKTDVEKMEAVAFSILSAIDGCSASLPAFILAPYPHEDDKKYSQEEGKKWYPQNHESIVNCDIAGSLHEKFNNYRRK